MSLGKMTHDDTEEDKNNLVNTAAKNTTSSEWWAFPSILYPCRWLHKGIIILWKIIACALKCRSKIVWGFLTYNFFSLLLHDLFTASFRFYFFLEVMMFDFLLKDIRLLSPQQGYIYKDEHYFRDPNSCRETLSVASIIWQYICVFKRNSAVSFLQCFWSAYTIGTPAKL